MEKIKTGIASFGLSGQVFHAPFLDMHEGFELSVIAERSNNLARGAYPGVQVVRSFDACSQRISNWSWSIPPDRLMPIIAGRPSKRANT